MKELRLEGTLKELITLFLHFSSLYSHELSPGHSSALVPHCGEVFFEGYNDELVEECDIVASMPSVPDSKKHKSGSLTHLETHKSFLKFIWNYIPSDCSGT